MDIYIVSIIVLYLTSLSVPGIQQPTRTTTAMPTTYTERDRLLQSSSSSSSVTTLEPSKYGLDFSSPVQSISSLGPLEISAGSRQRILVGIWLGQFLSVRWHCYWTVKYDCWYSYRRWTVRIFLHLKNWHWLIYNRYILLVSFIQWLSSPLVCVDFLMNLFMYWNNPTPSASLNIVRVSEVKWSQLGWYLVRNPFVSC